MLQSDDDALAVLKSEYNNLGQLLDQLNCVRKLLTELDALDGLRRRAEVVQHGLVQKIKKELLIQDILESDLFVLRRLTFDYDKSSFSSDELPQTRSLIREKNSGALPN